MSWSREAIPYRASSFLHWLVAGVRGSCSVAGQLGRPACYSHADWRGFHSPDECGGGCDFARAGPALRRVYEAHETARALYLLRLRKSYYGQGPARYLELRRWFHVARSNIRSFMDLTGECVCGEARLRQVASVPAAAAATASRQATARQARPAFTPRGRGQRPRLQFSSFLIREHAGNGYAA